MTKQNIYAAKESAPLFSKYNSKTLLLWGTEKKLKAEPFIKVLYYLVANKKRNTRLVVAAVISNWSHGNYLQPKFSIAGVSN